jgi:hypothetical protein
MAWRLIGWTAPALVGLVGLVAACAMTACSGSPRNLSEGAGESPGAPTRVPVDQSAAEGAVFCVQGALRSCLVQLPTQGTIHNCWVGKQLCSGGTWTDCQDPSSLVGVRTQTFTASCLAGDTIRWTTLDYVVDAPADRSGVASVTIAVAGHPDFALLDVRSNDPSLVKGLVKGGAGSLNIEPLLGALSAQSDLTLQITTTTTPDGAMASTATAELSYACSSGPAP